MIPSWAVRCCSLLAYLVLAARAHRPARLRAALLLAVALASLVFVHYRVLVFALGLALV